MGIPNVTGQFQEKIIVFYDWMIFFGLCAAIFVLPASIAILDSFAGLAILFYLIKKINLMLVHWPSRTSSLTFMGKIQFVLGSFVPAVNVLGNPLLYLTIALLISVTLSQYPALSITAFVGKFLKGVFLYFCCLEVINNEQRVKLFIGVLLLSAGIEALSGIVQHFTGRDFIKGQRMGMEGLIPSHRIKATFMSANGLGAFLLPSIGMCTQCLYRMLIKQRSLLWAALLTVLLFTLLVCLCWTYSRSSWIGFIFILLAIIILDIRKSLFAGCLLLIFVFIFMPSLKTVRHMNLIKDQIPTVQSEETIDKGTETKNIPVQTMNLKTMIKEGGSGRSLFWKKAISIIRTSPIWGTGLNTYTRIIQRNPDKSTWWYAHNSYLQLTAETGFIGLGCFLWFLFALVRHGFVMSYRIKDSWILTYLQGAIAGLVGYLVQSFFDNTLYTVQLSALMWLACGLLIAVTRLGALKEAREGVVLGQ